MLANTIAGTMPVYILTPFVCRERFSCHIFLALLLPAALLNISNFAKNHLVRCRATVASHLYLTHSHLCSWFSLPLVFLCLHPVLPARHPYPLYYSPVSFRPFLARSPSPFLSQPLLISLAFPNLHLFSQVYSYCNSTTIYYLST